MPPLEGRRVGLLETRRSHELAELVVRLGGVPVCAPAVREVALAQDAAPLLARIAAGGYDLAVVMTAAAFNALCDAADRQHLLPSVRGAFARMTIACRGPKPQFALKKHGLKAAVVTSPPHTSGDLLEALGAVPLAGVPVLLLHHGERNDRFAAALEERGAAVENVCLYEWQLPEDVSPLERMVAAIAGGEIDAMLFTSQVQWRHLLQIAERLGAADGLRTGLRRAVVGAIGPVCAGALRAEGIVPDVMPALPNSPSLVRALADYFSLTADGPGR